MHAFRCSREICHTVYLVGLQLLELLFLVFTVLKIVFCYLLLLLFVFHDIIHWFVKNS